MSFDPRENLSILPTVPVPQTSGVGISPRQNPIPGQTGPGVGPGNVGGDPQFPQAGLIPTPRFPSEIRAEEELASQDIDLKTDEDGNIGWLATLAPILGAAGLAGLGAAIGGRGGLALGAAAAGGLTGFAEGTEFADKLREREEVREERRQVRLDRNAQSAISLIERLIEANDTSAALNAIQEAQSKGHITPSMAEAFTDAANNGKDEFDRDRNLVRLEKALTGMVSSAKDFKELANLIDASTLPEEDQESLRFFFNGAFKTELERRGKVGDAETKDFWTAFKAAESSISGLEGFESLFAEEIASRPEFGVSLKAAKERAQRVESEKETAAELAEELRKQDIFRGYMANYSFYRERSEFKRAAEVKLLAELRYGMRDEAATEEEIEAEADAIKGRIRMENFQDTFEALSAIALQADMTIPDFKHMVSTYGREILAVKNLDNESIDEAAERLSKRYTIGIRPGPTSEKEEEDILNRVPLDLQVEAIGDPALVEKIQEIIRRKLAIARNTPDDTPKPSRSERVIRANSILP